MDEDTQVKLHNIIVSLRFLMHKIEDKEILTDLIFQINTLYNILREE